jgi:O-antigen ligase
VVAQSKLTHNILLDLALRTGVVGLILFVVAVALTFRDGVRTWLRQSDDRIAALALACTAALAALLAKGMVESLFEKYRLAVFLGLLVGVMISGALATRSEGAAEPASSRRRGRRASDPLVPLGPVGAGVPVTAPRAGAAAAGGAGPFGAVPARAPTRGPTR